MDSSVIIRSFGGSKPRFYDPMISGRGRAYRLSDADAAFKKDLAEFTAHVAMQQRGRYWKIEFVGL